MTDSSAAPAIANVLVKASGLKSRPSCCSSENTGRNDTVMMSSEKKSGGPTCFVASRTTSHRGRPSARSRCLCMFSIITIAASTIAPIAIAIPPRLMMLALTPMARMTRNEIRMPSGSVTIATSAERRCSRNSTDDRGDDQRLLEQRAPQIPDRPVNQLGAVVHRDEAHARRAACAGSR